MKPIHYALTALTVWGLAGLVTPAVATPPSPCPPGTDPCPFVQDLLARGTDRSLDGTLTLHFGADVVVSRITVQPGAYSGWHSHPGGAIIVVKEGYATVYRSVGSQCEKTTYGPGDAFIERPGELDQVVNETSGPDAQQYVLVVTFPRVPDGESPRITEDNPGTCPPGTP
jgi:quercetin dioxygenase-like cupin family protein